MTIKIKVINQLTGKVQIDSQIEVDSTWGIVSENHETLRQFFPDCQVSFYTEDNESMSMIFAPAVNMERDEQAYHDGLISWEQYHDKWFKNNQEDSDLVTLERYENDLVTLERY